MIGKGVKELFTKLFSKNKKDATVELFEKVNRRRKTIDKAAVARLNAAIKPVKPANRHERRTRAKLYRVERELAIKRAYAYIARQVAQQIADEPRLETSYFTNGYKRQPKRA